MPLAIGEGGNFDLFTLLELCPLLDPDETITLERIEDRIDWFLSACLKVTFGPPI